MEHLKLTLGFSPCPNDTYMFAALVNGWINTRGLSFDVRMEDVETLNSLAGEGQLDITKMSFHRAFDLEDQYSLLHSGAALGRGCGPLVIARAPMTVEEVIQGPTALPGQWTTAHLLFNTFFPGARQKIFMPFERIESSVLSGETATGVIIHENRFTYEAKGLVRITDLGAAWENLTGLPIPLGGIYASHRLPDGLQPIIAQCIRDSIHYAARHPDQVMPFVRQYAQEMDDQVMAEHIGLYVNDFSLDLGQEGLEAVRYLKKVLG